MASKAKYVKVLVTVVGEKSLSGYRVVGDFVEYPSGRTLLLERPDLEAAPRKRAPNKKSAGAGTATAFPGAASAGVSA